MVKASKGIVKMLPFFVNWANLLKMLLDVIQYPLAIIAQQDTLYHLSHDLKASTTLWKIIVIFRSVNNA